MIFRRKKDDDALNPTGENIDLEQDISTTHDEVVAESEATKVVEAEAGPDPEVDRSGGPFDLTEVEESDAMEAQRIDLGSLQIPLIEGLEIRVEVDEGTNQPMAITLIRGAGAVQVRLFSAPRSGGGWREARADISRSLTADGGTVDEAISDFGVELLAKLPGQDESGKPMLQSVRFLGVDGPRWMLQGVMLGVGAQADQAGELEEVFRGIVVVRGDEAMPPGNALPITLPQQVPGDVVLEEDEDDEEGRADEVGEDGAPEPEGARG